MSFTQMNDITKVKKKNIICACIAENVVIVECEIL